MTSSVKSASWGFCEMLCLLLGSFLLTPALGWSSAGETTLRDTIMVGYERSVRASAAVEVFVMFQMNSIEEVNIKAQTFTVSGWWTLSWTDSRLVWDPASHSNIEYVKFPPRALWTPALVVTNDVNKLSALDTDNIPIRVKYDGTVQWHPSGINILNCEMDASKFPFDDHTCYIQVTSTGYTLQEVICNTTRGIEMSDYHESGEWEVKDIWNTYEVYTDSGEDYSRLTFYITVHRLNMFYWFSILIPVMFCASLVTVVFAVPVESGEKMGYALTCLLTFVILLTLIAEELPTSAKHVNIIDVYLSNVLCISALSVVLSIISIKYYNLPEDERIPGWIISLTIKFWPWVDDRKKAEEHNLEHAEKTNMEETTASITNLGEGFQRYVTESSDVPHSSRPSSAGSNAGNKTRVFSKEVQEETEEGLEGRSPSNPIRGTYDADLVTGEVISRVMDAVFLRISAVIVVIMTFIIMVVIAT